jgi:leukotriene A-4 hydrolase/aminopeptidase
MKNEKWGLHEILEAGSWKLEIHKSISINRNHYNRQYMKFNFLILIVICMIAYSCKQDQKSSASENTKETPVMDQHTYARPSEAVVNHLSLDLTADFTNKKIFGTASYQITVHEGADSIYFDVKDLDIRQVKVDGQEVQFKLGETKEFLGQPLAVPLNAGAKQVDIQYATGPGAEALQWLEPSQTAGKKLPYLFTQGQAILTRTWIPIQDSPGIRMTYDAKITVPKELMAVMSASNPQTKSADGVYTFKMEQPIPAYLIALAIGDIEFKSLGTRTGVYTEPSMMEKTAAELSDTEKMVEAAEALYGPYLWERYDLIVLPPSFPFGGMENPRLTFATPTIIAGDKSLVALIAHELAHSWSGNLVTNATWNDFWLNEGFTVYFESRIMEALYGKSYTAMLTSLGYQSMKATVEELDPKDTHLFLDLAGRNPDDGMTDIAYEKGAHFLMMLEQKVGREKFDQFLKAYFKDHQFQSMTTEKFIQYLQENLLKPNQVDVNIEEWIYGPGLPSNTPVVESERFAAVDKQASGFIQGQSAQILQTKDYTTQEWLHFILAMPDTLTDKQMKDLDATFGFTKSGNREIQAAWYKLAINQGYAKEIMPSIEKFLIEVGRRKFLTPLYTAMMNKGMAEDAKRIYAKARPNYHSVAYNTMDKLVK